MHTMWKKLQFKVSMKINLGVPSHMTCCGLVSEDFPNSKTINHLGLVKYETDGVNACSTRSDPIIRMCPRTRPTPVTRVALFWLNIEMFRKVSFQRSLPIIS